LDTVNSAFDETDSAEAEEGDRAWFVFVAAKPTELSPPRTSVDRYKKSGGRDWRPFHPDVKDSIGLLAQEAAAQYRRYFTELPMPADLRVTLDAAQDAHEPVVVVVDPWTLGVEDYRAEMRKLDKYIADTCGILVSWNAPDAETTQSERARLAELLAKTFPYRIKLGTALHYWGEVESATDLKARLLAMLAHYTNKVIENTHAEKTIPEHEVLPAGEAPVVSLAQPPLVTNQQRPNG
jgi:FxsC-like protein